MSACLKNQKSISHKARHGCALALGAGAQRRNVGQHPRLRRGEGALPLPVVAGTCRGGVAGCRQSAGGSPWAAGIFAAFTTADQAGGTASRRGAVVRQSSERRVAGAQPRCDHTAFGGLAEDAPQLAAGAGRAQGVRKLWGPLLQPRTGGGGQITNRRNGPDHRAGQPRPRDPGA